MKNKLMRISPRSILANERGAFSLVFALAAAGVVMMAALSASQWSTKTLQQHKYDDPSKAAAFIRQRVINTLSSPGAWDQTVLRNSTLNCLNPGGNVIGAASPTPGGNSGTGSTPGGNGNGTPSPTPVVTTLKNGKVKIKGNCNFGSNFVAIDLYTGAGDSFLRSTDPSVGFDLKGEPCNTYNQVDGNDQCAFRYTLQTLVDCTVTVNGQCRIDLLGQLSFNPAKVASNILVKNLNASNYNFQFSLGGQEGTLESACNVAGGMYDYATRTCDMTGINFSTPKTQMTVDQLAKVCPSVAAAVSTAIGSGNTSTPVVLTDCKLGANLSSVCPAGKIFAGTNTDGSNDCRDVPFQASCFVGGTAFAEGGSATFYKSATVPYGQFCNSELRTCTNSVMSGSYTQASCVVEPPADCNLDGQTIAHGSTVNSFITARPGDSDPGGTVYGACTQVARTCNNGVMSGPTDYEFKSCSPANGAPCTFGTKRISDGVTVDAYKVGSVAYGSSCSPQKGSVTCNNGVLTNAATYPFSKCTVAGGAKCTTREHHDEVNDEDDHDFYAVASAPEGRTCAQFRERKTCKNGDFVGEMSARYESCSDSTVKCRLASKDYNYNDVVMAYKKKTVASGVSCTDYGNAALLKCGNGSKWYYGDGSVANTSSGHDDDDDDDDHSGSGSGSYSAGYSYTSCTNSAASACTFTTKDGISKTINSGMSAVMYSVASSVSCSHKAVSVSCYKGVTSPGGTSYYSKCTDICYNQFGQVVACP